MRKTILSILLGLASCIGSNLIDQANAQGEVQPNIKVSVVILAPDQSTTADTLNFDDPIYARISLQVGDQPLYTSARFEERDFHLDLFFTLTRPDGSKELIAAAHPTGVDLKPPRIETQTGIQVEAIEALPAGWVWTVGPFDAKDWYALRSGLLSVSAKVTMVSYPQSVIKEVSGLMYAPIDSAQWSGELKSVPVNFTISGEFCAGGEKPQKLVLEYAGTDCGASSNSQEQDLCQGDPLGASPVRIIATTKQDPFHTKAKVWFDGEVSLRENPVFELDATNCQGEACRDETRLGGQTYISIFDNSGSLLQGVAFHTSCSESLNFGDQFGSLRLVGFTPEP